MGGQLSIGALSSIGKLLGGSSEMVGNIVAGRRMKKEMKRQEELKDAAQETLDDLKENRQAIVNPYSDTKEMRMDNPYANLAVATEAATMQMEQADIALANTLDTLRETGSSAGGATALANAALKSKRGITASIQKQEATNQQLSAKGEMQAQQLTQAEKARVQENQAQGKAFMFNAQEMREAADISRAASEVDYYRGMQDYYASARIGQGARTASSMMNFAGSTTQYIAGGKMASTQPGNAFQDYANSSNPFIGG